MASGFTIIGIACSRRGRGKEKRKSADSGLIVFESRTRTRQYKSIVAAAPCSVISEVQPNCEIWRFHILATYYLLSSVFPISVISGWTVPELAEFGMSTVDKTWELPFV